MPESKDVWTIGKLMELLGGEYDGVRLAVDGYSDGDVRDVVTVQIRADRKGDFLIVFGPKLIHQ